VTSSDEQAVETLFAKLGAFDHLVFTAGDSLHLPRPCHHRSQNRPDAPLSCVIGLYWLRLNTEARIFAMGGSVRAHPPESPGSARKRGWVVAASVCGTIEALTRALLWNWRRYASTRCVPASLDEPLAEHECSRTGAAVESVGKESAYGRVGEPHDIAQAYVF